MDLLAYYLHYSGEVENVYIRDGKEPSLFGFGSVQVLQPPGFGSVVKCQVFLHCKTPQKKTFVLLCQNDVQNLGKSSPTVSKSVSK